MKTNLINKIVLEAFIVLCLMLTFTSCSNDVDFGEQYKKVVYIVNSSDLLYVAKHSFETQKDEISISIYCASSVPITKELRVRLKVNRHALDSLNMIKQLADPNYENRVMLPEANYTLEGEQYATIKAGEQYGVLKIPFNSLGLDPTIPYALPISLVSNSTDYDMNSNLGSIVYELNMINKFAGIYTGSSQTSPTAIFGIQPTLKALSIDEIRLPIHNLLDDPKSILTNYMLLKIAKDNTVAISPSGIADVTDLGDSFYDPVNQSFKLHYQFVDATAKTQTVTSSIRNIDAPQVEEGDF